MARSGPSINSINVVFLQVVKRIHAFENSMLSGLMIIMTAYGTAPSQSAAAGGWQFSWSDEFNGPAIDASVWGYENGYVRNSELQYYTNRPENARIDNGNLLIQALRDNWNGHEYTAASLRTMGKKSWQYGKFEMRAKIDIRPGSWPAWWWLPNTGGWPRGGEIDMMEFYKSMCLFNVMDGNQKWTSITRTIASLGGTVWADNFHVWTWEWDSAKIDLSLDGVLMNHYLLSNADGTGPNGDNPFRRPGYMLVNQALGGANGGDPSGTAFPVEYRVDWIRVHTWSTAGAYTLTVNEGVGSGLYIAGTRASITAKMASTGQVFDTWVIDAGNAAVDDLAAPSATLTMPASEVTVTATYRTGTFVSPRRTPGPAVHGITRDCPAVMYDIKGKRIAMIDGRYSRLPAGVYISLRKGRVARMPVIYRE
jgi:beta-glucanase (GH16 family)